MTAQAYCTVRTVPMPLGIYQPGTAAMSIQITGIMNIQWSVGLAESLGILLPAVSLYDGTTKTFAGDQFVWLVVLSQLTGKLWLVKELDYANIGTLLDAQSGGDWAVYARIDGIQAYLLPQI